MERTHRTVCMSLRETLRAGVCERLVAGELAESEEAALAARERGEEALTQFGQVMKQLGIEMIPAGSPQAKGRVERSYRTLQDRLLKELRLEGVGHAGRGQPVPAPGLHPGL